ncbi:unnamed protein product, partial [Mesorhabditis spiculigera]
MNVIKLFSRRLSTGPIPDFLKVSDEVTAALHENRAIVALESTIIAHGLPYPTNLETGLELEQIVRSESAVPATVAIMNGKVCVGLTEAELSEIAESKNVAKISRRDMARCVANKALGATTVASTMWAAHQAGIRVFATGGIGGVHRYAQETFDISADLQELAATPVTVVCAGVKSILDIPKTLEYLETHSVNTIVYSTKNDFPAFFARESGSKGQFSTMDLAEAARIIETSKSLGLPAGTILACPIPEEFAAKGKVIEEAIKQALEEARAQNIMGQATTPFLLSRVKELTGGESLKSNVALVKNNAKIAAKLANHLVGRSKNSEPSQSPAIAARKREIQKPVRPKVVTIGAAICDFEAITSADVKNDGGSYPGIVTQRPGGVGRNHADVMARLGLDSALLTYVGNDENGRFLRRTGQHIDLSGVKTVDAPTATYCAINMRGNVRFGISCIEEIMGKMGPEIVHANMDLLEEADFLVIDGNTNVETLKEAIEVAYRINLPIWFEPTDIDKMQKLFKAGNIEKVSEREIVGMADFWPAT